MDQFKPNERIVHWVLSKVAKKESINLQYDYQIENFDYLLKKHFIFRDSAGELHLETEGAILLESYNERYGDPEKYDSIGSFNPHELPLQTPPKQSESSGY